MELWRLMPVDVKATPESVVIEQATDAIRPMALRRAMMQVASVSGTR